MRNVKSGPTWTVTCALLLLLLLLAAPIRAAEPSAVPGCEDPSEQVAIVAGKALTLAELDQRASSGLIEAREAVYAARRSALDELVGDALIDHEAGVRGVSREALLAAEVTAKVVEPTNEEIDAVYEQAKARLEGAKKADVVPQIVAYLKGQREEEARATFLGQLETKYGVERLLEPPRVAVSPDDDASRGPVDAPVTIVEFSDYECPFCARVEPTLAELKARYGDQIRLVYRDFPLSFHADAQRAAEASECADDQGKFWEMHDAMFADQAKLSKADLVATAARLGLDRKAFEQCLGSGKHAAEVAKDLADGQKAGVTGTPAFFVEGVALRGAMPLASFTKVIDAALAKKARKARKADGAKGN